MRHKIGILIQFGLSSHTTHTHTKRTTWKWKISWHLYRNGIVSFFFSVSLSCRCCVLTDTSDMSEVRGSTCTKRHRLTISSFNVSVLCVYRYTVYHDKDVSCFWLLIFRRATFHWEWVYLKVSSDYFLYRISFVSRVSSWFCL